MGLLNSVQMLLIQMARQFQGQVWQDYDIAFRKDAAATGLTDWSRMNLDLYNLHTRSPFGSSTHSLLHHRPSSQFSYKDAPKSPHYSILGTMENVAGLSAAFV